MSSIRRTMRRARDYQGPDAWSPSKRRGVKHASERSIARSVALDAHRYAGWIMVALAFGLVALAVLS